MHLNPQIFAILNLTPDSFSDGGKWNEESLAIDRARELICQGADAIDVGAEASGPNSKPVGSETERKRLLSLVSALSKELPICIDTYRAKTARLCLERGAQIINDISGLRHDKEMASTVAEFNAKIVIMHSKERGENPHVSKRAAVYKDIVLEISDFLKQRVDFALCAGVKQERIILDPGMGAFISNDPQDSWTLLARFSELVETLKPFPLMVAVSRKGFLGGELQERDAMSQLVSLLATNAGAKIIRTHAPKMTLDFIKVQERLSGKANERKFS